MLKYIRLNWFCCWESRKRGKEHVEVHREGGDGKSCPAAAEPGACVLCALQLCSRWFAGAMETGGSHGDQGDQGDRQYSCRVDVCGELLLPVFMKGTVQPNE